MIIPYSNKEYRLINPTEIDDIDKPEFGKYNRRTELEYKQLLEDSQEYFCKYVENPNNNSFWIYKHVNAAYLYIDIGHAITVCKKENGKYIVASNGRHRLYVAKKYELPVLVCVFDE